MIDVYGRTTGNIQELTKRTNDFLNNQVLRIQYANASQYIVSSRLVEDETTYYRAFRDSIEVALFAGTEHEEVEAEVDAKEEEKTDNTEGKKIHE